MADRWRRRSRRAKVALVAAAVFGAFGVVGALTDAQPEEEPAAGRLTAAGAAAGSATVPASKTVSARSKAGGERTPAVRRVVDGDTIELANGTVVRLVQIDAPELASRECYAAQSAATLRRLLPPGRSVRVVTDPRLDEQDRYGRQLAYVFKGSELLQATLVARGAASPWFFDGDRGRYASRLLARARAAKSAARGLWGACPGTRLDPSRALATARPAPKPDPPAKTQPASPRQKCHPSYEGECLDPSLSDYDCAGGSGDGPGYVNAAVRVVGPDDYRLDGDGDGYGCE